MFSSCGFPESPRRQLFPQRGGTRATPHRLPLQPYLLLLSLLGLGLLACKMGIKVNFHRGLWGETKHKASVRCWARRLRDYWWWIVPSSLLSSLSKATASRVGTGALPMQSLFGANVTSGQTTGQTSDSGVDPVAKSQMHFES